MEYIDTVIIGLDNVFFLFSAVVAEKYVLSTDPNANH